MFQKTQPRIVAIVFCLAMALMMFSVSGQAQPNDEMTGRGIQKEFVSLLQKFKAMEQKLGIQEDTTDIRKLMNIYGYYMEAHMSTRIVDLFTENNPSVMMASRGIYKGSKDRIRTAYVDVDGRGFPDGVTAFGRFGSVNMVHDVITVAPDRKTAKGRFKAIILVGGFKQSALWQLITYEGGFVREQGKWKIKDLVVQGMYGGPYQDFWNNPYTPPPVLSQFPPDELTDGVHSFPEPSIRPFDFRHPITGEMIPSELFYDPAQPPYWCRDAEGKYAPCE